MRLTQQQLEAHLWGAANILRGKTAGQDYKNYILSLMFYKRLCDQWESEADDAIAVLEQQQGRAFTEAQKAIFRARGEHRFNIPDGSRWGDVLARLRTQTEKAKAETALRKLESQRAKPAAKVAERDERIAETRRRAEDDRREVDQVGSELGTLYGDPDELLKHARVVGLDEIAENEFNLNIPRYVDTFEPEPRVEVREALWALQQAENEVAIAESNLLKLLREIGYGTE